MKVTVMGVDPSLRNTGIAIASINPQTNEILSIDDLILIRTQPGPKSQRKSSADYEAASVISATIRNAVEQHNPKVVFAEIPSGAQSARASFALGITLGIMATMWPKPIEVTPQQTKLQSVGIRTATKGEMIEWAVGKYPEAPWHRSTTGRIMNANEHLADACGVIYAGIVTPEWEVIRNLL